MTKLRERILKVSLIVQEFTGLAIQHLKGKLLKMSPLNLKGKHIDQGIGPGPIR